MSCLFRKSFCYFYVLLSVFFCTTQLPLSAECHRDIVVDRIKARRIKANKIVTRNEKVTNKLTVKKVDNNIGDTYVVGTDIGSIQEGINLVNSGLKPEAASKSSTDPGARNVTLQIPAGTYHESLFIDTDLSDPTFSDPGTDTPNIQSRGLRLEGDLRPIAAMTYMKGGLVETDPSFAQDSGLNSLGTQGSLVDLSPSGNTLTVTNSPGPSPNFNACGVVAGDTVVVTDNEGTMQQRTVIAVSNNKLTLDAGVTISGNGAALTFCPNVQIVSSNPDYLCLIVSGAVEVTGIRLSIDPALAANSIYGIYVEGTGTLFISRVLIDEQNLDTFSSLETANGGQIIQELVNGEITGHVSLINTLFGAGNRGSITFGNWYVMAGPSLPVCALHNEESFFNALHSIQVNGAGFAIGYELPFLSFSYINRFAAFNCFIGILLQTQCDLIIDTSVYLENCTAYGLYIEDGQFLCYNELAPLTIKDSEVAIFIYGVGELRVDNDTEISSTSLVAIGIEISNGGLFSSSGNIAFTNIYYPYAIDGTSSYSTPNNAGTLNNIYTYTSNGAMNSAYLTQLLNGTALTLDPGATVEGIKIYQGKVFTLTNTGTLSSLTLSSGSFVGGGTSENLAGAGSTLTLEVIDDTTVIILGKLP